MIKSSGLFFSLTILLSSTIFAQPVIQGFSPASGPVGTTVSIKGRGFDTIVSNNIVFFGAVRGTVSSSTDTSIVTTVPSGASYQPITVTTGKGTAYSSLPFVVTFGGATGTFTPASFLPKIDFTSGNYPHAISLADFNNDGKPDMLVAKGSSTSTSLFTNTSSNGTVSFSGPLEITATGNSHECSATGDLDGDGKIDLVTANTWNTNSISVFRNTTTGTSISFAPKQDYATDNGAYSVSIADLDGDGKPDIAVANNGSNVISLYKNKSTPGSVSFDNRIDIAAGTNPYSVVIGDLDGDNKPELVYTTQATGSALSVMKNHSVKDTFSFETPVVLANFSAPFVVTIGDLDGDNLPDVVAAGAGTNIIVVKRNLSTPGNLAFSGQQNYYSTSDYPEGVALADIDGDGKPDIAASNRMTNTVSVLQNTSSSGSISFNTHVDYAVGEIPIFLAIADLNSDQRPDIVVANSSNSFVSVLTNIVGANVAPTIQSFTPTSGINGTAVTIKGTNFTGATSVKFGGVNAASFTVDSDSTITANVGQGNSGDVSVTTPKGTVSMAGFTFLGATITSFTPTTGVAGSTVNIYGTNFTNVSSVKFGGTAAASFIVNTPTFITAVVGNGSSGDVSVVTSNGTATLSGFSYAVPIITSINPLYAPVGDTITITGKNFSSTANDNTVFFGAVKAAVTSARDTLLKVIVPAGATYKPVTVTVNRLTAYSALPFSASFAADSTAITANSFSNAGNYSAGSYPFAVALCDLNDDGKPDIITVNSLGNSISVLKNISTQGNLSFLQKTDLATGPDPKRLAIGDLDGDGKPDIAVVNFNAGNTSTISVFRNTSSASTISFAPKTDYATGNGTLGIGIADFNGDGKPDIVTTSGNSGFLSLFQNTTAAVGTISLAARQDISNLNHADDLTIADLDKDGKPDIIASEFSSGNVAVYRNLSSGGNLQFDTRRAFTAGTYPSNIETGDLDGDSKPDVILRNESTVSLLKNSSTPGTISIQNAYNFYLSATNASVSDLNGDGKPDLCLGRTSSGNISVIENKYIAAGTPAFSSNVDLKPGNYDTFVATGDLDGDGKPELVAANTLLYTVTLYSNKTGSPVINPPSVLSAKAGDTLSIPGSHLAGATSVKLGGTPVASFQVISANRIDAIVAGGASGNITVTTPGGTASYSGFNFIPVITANGPTTFCNEVSVQLTSSADANNQWYRNNTLIAGATSKTYSAATSGNYTVKTTSNGITTASVNGIDVTVTTVPAPAITLSGNSLMSSATSGNQWYLNGTPIPGATAQTYQPTQSGNYAVQATVNGCSSALSAAYNFVLTGIINLDNGQFIKLYPNPIKDKLIVSYQLNGSSSLTIAIFDSNGRQVRTESKLHSGDVVSLRGLPAGLYIVKLSSKQKQFENIKLIKTD